MGLLGTVFGMIRAFSAIATSGAPDAVALSTKGISEALINTALGISHPLSLLLLIIGLVKELIQTYLWNEMKAG